MTLDSGLQINSPVPICASSSELTGSGWTTVYRCRFSFRTVSLRALSLHLNRNCFNFSIRLKLARLALGPDRAFVQADLHFTFKCVSSGGVQSLCREWGVGTPPWEQQDMDQLHQLQSQQHQPPNGEWDSSWHRTRTRPGPASVWVLSSSCCRQPWLIFTWWWLATPSRWCRCSYL